MALLQQKVDALDVAVRGYRRQQEAELRLRQAAHTLTQLPRDAAGRDKGAATRQPTDDAVQETHDAR